MLVREQAAERGRCRDCGRHGGLSGFTLIELLVVIAIIGILAALLLPGLSRGKQQAQAAKCASNLKEMGLALNMYVGDYRAYPLYYAANGTEMYDGTIEAGFCWETLLVPYLGCPWTNRAIQCPAYTGLVTYGITNSGVISPVGSYGYNYAGILQGGGLLGLGNRQAGPDEPVREDQVIVPSDMFAIGDTRIVTPAWTGRYDVYTGSGIDNLCIGTDQTFYAYPLRHGEDYGVVFCDGHVIHIRPALLYDPTNTAPQWNNDHQPHTEYWFWNESPIGFL
jgi:prepilin-type N-terminal cleavage/methylation domain-containing protein/prepilin-type processing-associated H-X9-DG protein